MSKKLIDKLKKQLDQYREVYYKGDPIVPDDTYDELLKQYQSLTGNQEELPVGHALPSENLKKVRHQYPMRSLDNIFLEFDKEGNLSNADVIHAWKQRNENAVGRPLDYVLEPKYDGLAVAVYYLDGVLKDVVTRGDGDVGESVLPYIRSSLVTMHIPERINAKGTVQITGEVVLPLNEFYKLNESLDKTYKNPRNAAAGILRRQEDTHKPLLFMAYGAFSDHTYTKSTYRRTMIEVLDSDEFSTFELDNFLNGMFDDTKIYRDILLVNEDGYRYFNYSYYHEGILQQVQILTDGLVLKVDDFNAYDKLVGTRHHPDWAIALKMPTNKLSTRIVDIFGQVGKTGVVTPVAKLLPIQISGVEVSYATLNNFNFIKACGLNINDEVYVHRAGEVIPEIVSRVHPSVKEDYFKPFTHCPCCKSPLVEREGEGGFWYCSNADDCPDVLKARLEYAVSRDHLNLMGIGRSHIDTLFKEKSVRDWTDLYRLKEDDIRSVFTGKTGLMIWKAIDENRQIELHRVISSCNLSYIGRSRSKELARIWSQLDVPNSFSYLYQLKIDDIAKYSNIGDKFIDKYFDSTLPMAMRQFQLKGTQHKLYLSVLSLIENGCIEIIYPMKQEVDKLTLYGKTYCITGSFEEYSRSSIESFIESRGGQVTSSVSRRLTALICGENPGSKLSKAERIGVPIITDFSTFLIQHS